MGKEEILEREIEALRAVNEGLTKELNSLREKLLAGTESKRETPNQLQDILSKGDRFKCDMESEVILSLPIKISLLNMPMTSSYWLYY